MIALWRRWVGLVLVVGLVGVLSGCSSGCVACSEVQPIRSVVVNLCVSEVPDPVVGEGLCAAPVEVAYRFVRGGQ